MAACKPRRMNTIAQRDGIVRFCYQDNTGK